MRVRRTAKAALLLLACTACGKALFSDEDASAPDASAPDGGVSGEAGGADVDVGVDAAAPDAACPRDATGKCLPEVLLTGIGPTYAIVVSDGYVYYASYQFGKIGRVTVSDLVTTTLTDVSSPIGLGLDSTDVNVVAFLGGQLGLGRVARDGGTIVNADPSLSQCRAIALDGASIYALCGGASTKVVRRGASTAELSEPDAYGSDKPHQGAIAVDANHVYWTTPTQLRRANKDLSGPITIAEMKFSGQDFVAIALDATTIYARTTSTVRTFPKSGFDGGLGEELLTTSFEDVRVGFRVENGSINVVENKLNRIQRVPVGGGTPTTLVADGDGPLALALDNNYVYWTTISGALKRRRLE